jgi:hypothetical protein
MPSPGFDLESHVFYLFTQILGRRNRQLTERLSRFDITMPKWRILAVLHERPHSTTTHRMVGNGRDARATVAPAFGAALGTFHRPRKGEEQ